ncbi:hypothetical protein [Amycolatopsis sp. NPDC057786]|uniref:hypothetical protein n=1 Tax=Amycolatopsis sp. NPDC057786 TaxID=3346250 RepID=UPI00366AE21B
MRESEARSETVKGAKTSMSRELIELAALFIAAGAAHLFVSTLSLDRVGPAVLFGLGLLLIVTATLRRWWVHRPQASRRTVGEHEPLPGEAWRIRATVRDVPGSLAGVTAALAAHRYDIVSMQVLAVPDGAVDEFLLRAPAGATAADIAAVAELGGGRDVRVVPADVHEFVDPTTRVLTIAAGPRAGSAQLLRAVLGECDVAWQQARGRFAENVEGTSMRLIDPAGGPMLVTRPLLPFTPVEFARAKAVLALERRLAGTPEPTADADVVIEERHARCGLGPSSPEPGRVWSPRWGRRGKALRKRVREHRDDVVR